MPKKQKTEAQKDSWYRRECKMVWSKCSPDRWEVVRRCKLAVNQYKCEVCGAVVPYKLLEIDHKEPIIDPVKGYEGRQTWAWRLNVPAAGLQGLCPTCHTGKSRKENATRRSA